MQNYNYTGINKFGKRVNGVLPAANEQELEQKLKKMNNLTSDRLKPGQRLKVG